jgi:hypothetical protein
MNRSLSNVNVSPAGSVSDCIIVLTVDGEAPVSTKCKLRVADAPDTLQNIIVVTAYSPGSNTGELGGKILTPEVVIALLVIAICCP